MGAEFEVKFGASAEQLAAVRAAVGGEFTRIDMETTYYDTPGGALSARKWTLRRRMENGKAVCTVKTPGPEGSRGEWECGCGEITGAISMLCKLGAPPELAELTRGGVVPVCGARFTRLARTVVLEDGTAELALDAGVLLGGGKELPFAEIEAEQKTCSREALLGFARQLSLAHGLSPEKRSKFRRAWLLARENPE